jgi:hypothetical protein
MVGGYEYHDQFKPKNCDIIINTTAVTARAASYVSDIYSNLNQHNLTVVDGLGPEITMGGYLTGGGHSPISNIFGLGSDQVYEVEMVTPTGEIITANECQNTDLYPNKDNVASFEAIFLLYDPASTSTLEELLEPFLRHVSEAYSNQITTKATSEVFSNYYNMSLQYADDTGAGVDKVVGSRLLPPATLREEAFKDALIQFLGDAGGRLYMVSGKGVWNSKPRGGSDAVNPAWRKTLIHAGKSHWVVLER